MTSEQKSEQQIPKGSIVVLDGVKTFQLGWSDCTDSPIQEAFITLVNKECELYVPEVVLDRSITRLKEKKTKELLRKRKLSEEQEKFKNLLEYSVKAKLDSFLVTTIQEEDYQKLDEILKSTGVKTYRSFLDINKVGSLNANSANIATKIPAAVATNASLIAGAITLKLTFD